MNKAEKKIVPDIDLTPDSSIQLYASWMTVGSCEIQSKTLQSLTSTTDLVFLSVLYFFCLIACISLYLSERIEYLLKTLTPFEISIWGIYIPWNEEKGLRRLSWSYIINCLDFLETKWHVGVSQSNLACLNCLEGFWWPILINSLLWLSLTGFWWPIWTWLIWKRIVALETLSRRVLVTVLLKELDIEPIFLELAKLSLFHCHEVFHKNL